MPKALDITNRPYGRLTAIRRAANCSRGNARWVCQCECGNTCIVRVRHLVIGKTKSCGCIQWKGGQKNRGSLAWCNKSLNCQKTNSIARGYAQPLGNENDVLALWQSGANKCRITGKQFASGGCKPALDHCHITGKLRGFLTINANLAIGLLDDSAEQADAAAKYLAYHEMGDFIRKRCIA